MQHAFNEFNRDEIVKKNQCMPLHAPSAGAKVAEGQKGDVDETATDITLEKPN